MAGIDRALDSIWNIPGPQVRGGNVLRHADTDGDSTGNGRPDWLDDILEGKDSDDSDDDKKDSDKKESRRRLQADHADERAHGQRGDCPPCAGTGDIYGNGDCPVCGGTGDKPKPGDSAQHTTNPYGALDIWDSPSFNPKTFDPYSSPDSFMGEDKESSRRRRASDDDGTSDDFHGKSNGGKSDQQWSGQSDYLNSTVPPRAPEDNPSITADPILGSDGDSTICANCGGHVSAAGTNWTHDKSGSMFCPGHDQDVQRGPKNGSRRRGSNSDPSDGWTSQGTGHDSKALPGGGGAVAGENGQWVVYHGGNSPADSDQADHAGYAQNQDAAKQQAGQAMSQCPTCQSKSSGGSTNQMPPSQSRKREAHRAHKGQSCARWSHGAQNVAAYACIEQNGKHVALCKGHYQRFAGEDTNAEGADPEQAREENKDNSVSPTQTGLHDPGQDLAEPGKTSANWSLFF